MANQNYTKLAKVWDNLPGWGNLAAVNYHQRFMLTGVIFFLGILLAMLIRSQLALPGQTLITADLYSQVLLCTALL